MKNKESVNYKLINIALFIFIIYVLNKLNILNKIMDLILTILLSVILSYVVYPLYKKLSNKLNKYVSITLIYVSIFILIIFIIYSLIDGSSFIINLIDLFTNIIKFINKINTKYNLNINIDSYLESIITYLINNSVFVIKNVVDFISKLAFVFILSICILFNINYIKRTIKKMKYSLLIYNINEKLKNYVIANLKIILIQTIEYTLVFYIIGHPNYLLLGLLNSLNTMIPLFGSIITNVIAITTASVISTKLLILTSIISIILPNIDAYLITPKIYKSTNKLSQTLSISVVIIGGMLFGFYGVLLALPVLIIIIEIIKYKKLGRN